MKNYTVFLSAGEPSGDFLGSQLMKALKSQWGSCVTFVGVGGPLMAAEGLPSLFPIEDLAIMGLAEVIPHIWQIRRRIQETVAAIEKLRPDIVVTIDAPGFNFHVGKALKKRLPLIPLVHYVAPSVWAWRPKRARAIAQFLDHLLVLFPFEPPYFVKEGLPTTFVGHPVGELGLDKREDLSFRTRHNIPTTAPVLALLPGSRRGEIGRLLPVFEETARQLHQKYPDLHIVIPTLPHLKEQILQRFTLPATLVTTLEERGAAYQESRIALAASGTISLELAAAGLPMVIGYKINPLTYFIARRLVKIKYVCLVNILLNESAVPEQLQADCAPEKLRIALEELLQEGAARDQMKERMGEAIKKLEAPYGTPSLCAAQKILQMVG